MFLAIASRTKIKRVQPLALTLALVCCLCCACDKTQPTTSGEQTTTPQGVTSPQGDAEPATPPQDTVTTSISLSPLTISDDLPPNTKSVAWKPPREAIEQAVRAQIEQQGKPQGVSLTASDGAAHPATLHYAALELPAAPNSAPTYMIAASFDLQGKPRGWSSSRIERIDVLEELPPDEPARQALIMRKIDEATSALLLRQKIAMTPDTALLDALSTQDAPIPVEIAIDATQRLREDRKSQRKQIDPAGATKLLRTFATRDEPTLIPIVFTALSEYQALDGLGPLLVEAATRASQNQQLPVYLSLLSQMALVSDDTTRTYLESVASGHSEAMIRQIAQESLDKQRTLPKP